MPSESVKIYSFRGLMLSVTSSRPKCTCTYEYTAYGPRPFAYFAARRPSYLEAEVRHRVDRRQAADPLSRHIPAEHRHSMGVVRELPVFFAEKDQAERLGL